MVRLLITVELEKVKKQEAVACFKEPGGTEKDHEDFVCIRNGYLPNKSWKGLLRRANCLV